MSRLDRFSARPKKYVIAGEELQLHPLTLKDMIAFTKTTSGNPETEAEGMLEMVKKTMKKAVPDCTDEEIENMGLNVFQELMRAIMDVNGLQQPSEETKQKAVEALMTPK